MVIIMKFIRKHALFITVALLCITIVFSNFIFLGTDYVIGYDTKNIYVPFYEEIRTLIQNMELPFWSHNFFLGGNILASKGYYFLGDLFAYFSVLLPKVRIEEVLLVIQVIKFILCTVLMYMTLQEMKIRKQISWFASLFFTFSSWMLIFMGTPAFASFAALLPLLMLALERYLNKGKFGLVALAAFLLVMDNFYLFWSASFYLVLYWPCRYYLRHEFNKESILPFIKSTAFLLLIYCLGVFAGGFMLIPTLSYMMEVPRVTSNVEYTLLWESKRVYLDMFIKWISSPYYVNTSIPNFFGNNYYRTDQIALFSSSLITLIMPQIFTVFNRRQRNVLVIFFAFNGIMLIFPFFGSLMHGFAEPSFRWTIMLVMSIVLTGAQILNRYEKINIKLLVGTIIFYLFGLAAILIFVSREKPLSRYPEQMTMILISFVLFIVYAALLLLSKKHKTVILLVGLIAAVECTFISKLSLDNYANTFQEGYHYDELGIDKDYFSSLSDQKDEFYRIYINEYHVDLDHLQSFNYNSNMYYNFKGLYGYDSTTQPSTAEILLWSEEYYWWYRINNPALHDVLTTKYYVVSTEEELPDAQFEYIENIGNSKYKLYKNLDYKPFGFTYGNVMSTSEFYLYPGMEQKTEAFRKGIIFNDQDISHYQLDSLRTDIPSESMKNVVYSNNHIQGNLYVPEKQLVFFSIPYDAGWTIKANGVEQEIILSEGGFMSILLDQGDYEITLDFYPTGLNLGIGISLISVLSIVILAFIQKKKNFMK